MVVAVPMDVDLLQIKMVEAQDDVVMAPQSHPAIPFPLGLHVLSAKFATNLVTLL